MADAAATPNTRASDPTATTASATSLHPVAPLRLPVAAWAILTLALVIRCVAPDLAYFNIHVERDLYRAAEMMTGARFHMTGPELSYGGRTFGPFVYFLYAIPLAITTDPAAVTIFAGLWGTLALWLWFLFARRYFGGRVALWSLALWAFFPLEIVELRFLWNPSFLGPFIVGGVWGLFLVCVERRPAGYALMAACWAAAFQLHLSAFVYFPAAILCALIYRAPLAWRWIAAAAVVLVLFFAPFVAHEVKAWVSDAPEDRSVVKQTIAAPDARQDKQPLWWPNPNFFAVGPRNLFVSLGEDGLQQGFCYLKLFRQDAVWAVGRIPKAVIAVGTRLSWLLVPLFFVGVWRLLVRSRSHTDAAPTDAPRGDRVRAQLIVWWLLPPLIVNAFFNFHQPADPDTNPYGLVPLRYFRVAWPAQFLLMAMALEWIAARRPAAARWLHLGVAGMAATLLAFCCVVLLVFARAGAVIPYASPRAEFGEARVPHLGRMKEIAALLASHGLTGEAFRTRVAARGVFTPYYGEASIDWFGIVRADATAPAAAAEADDSIAARTYAYIFAPERVADFTVDEAAALEILDTRDVGDVRVVIFRAAPAALPAWFDPAHMRNVWIPAMRDVL